MSDTTVFKVKPPFKWAGGKRKLVSEIKALMPAHYNRYFEPFVGGGALFFALTPKQAFLSDSNADLIATYKTVRDNVDELIEALSYYENTREYYNWVRERNFKIGSTIQRAADFIYCNKIGFNGLYRVNSSGQFNVPFGKYENPTICDEENLRACSAALKNVEIGCVDFSEIDMLVEKNDFVYFDPPYAPISKTSNFTSYTINGFTDSDQKRLRDFALELKRRGAHVVLSNSSAEIVHELYGRPEFKIKEVRMARNINSVGSGRGEIKELLIY